MEIVKNSIKCLCLHNFHLVPPKLLVLQSPTPGKSPPSQPFHLQEPTYLNVAQECLHPLQPAPSKMRSFVCAKVFRRLKLQLTFAQIQKVFCRDEIAAHQATVHQTTVPGLNSSWLQMR